MTCGPDTMIPRPPTEKVDLSADKQVEEDSKSGPLQPESFFQGARKLYYRPTTQVMLLGFVCFMCPGLYNALNGLGGGGRVDTVTNANANATHYATFAFFAFFSGYIFLISLESRLAELL